MTIEAATTPTEVARTIETQVTTPILQDLIVQQIDKSLTSILDAAVYYTISASAILDYFKTPIW